MGFSKCEADQCLFYKDRRQGPIIIVLYIDDSIIFGMREDTNKVIEGMEKMFNIKTEGN